jgi:hypothetical protein
MGSLIEASGGNTDMFNDCLGLFLLVSLPSQLLIFPSSTHKISRLI